MFTLKAFENWVVGVKDYKGDIITQERVNAAHKKLIEIHPKEVASITRKMVMGFCRLHFDVGSFTQLTIICCSQLAPIRVRKEVFPGHIRGKHGSRKNGEGPKVHNQEIGKCLPIRSPQLWNILTAVLSISISIHRDHSANSISIYRPTPHISMLNYANTNKFVFTKKLTILPWLYSKITDFQPKHTPSFA